LFQAPQLKDVRACDGNDITKPNSLVQGGVTPFYWTLKDVIREDRACAAD